MRKIVFLFVMVSMLAIATAAFADHGGIVHITGGARTMDVPSIGPKD